MWGQTCENVRKPWVLHLKHGLKKSGKDCEAAVAHKDKRRRPCGCFVTHASSFYIQQIELKAHGE